MRNIHWTELARETYTGVLIFTAEFSISAALDLEQAVELLLERLSKHPLSCPPSPSLPRFRRCIITKNASLVYEIRDEEVRVIAVVDNRANTLYF